MGTAIKHPVPDRVKPSFVIFDIRALSQSGLSVRVPGCQKLQITLVFHMMVYSCTHMATVGVKGLTIHLLHWREVCIKHRSGDPVHRSFQAAVFVAACRWSSQDATACAWGMSLHGCLGGAAVRASDFRSSGRWFDSRPGRNQHLGQLSLPSLQVR